MIRRPPRSTLFPTRRSSDLHALIDLEDAALAWRDDKGRVRIQQALPTVATGASTGGLAGALRSEETSELQSRQYLVCRLLLEKKKNLPPEAHDIAIVISNMS